jgi:hypothetical protein
MMKKHTILTPPEHKIINKRNARQQNKGVPKFLDDLFSSIPGEAVPSPEKDEWLEKVAGSYGTGKKDILTELW